jgi:hypothetical protein
MMSLRLNYYFHRKLELDLILMEVIYNLGPFGSRDCLMDSLSVLDRLAPQRDPLCR